MNRANRYTAPIDPPPVGYSADEAWLSDVTDDEWTDFARAVTCRAELQSGRCAS